jgi:WD40 repeat protein
LIQIFENLCRKKLLQIIKYNKNYQSFFESKLNDYKEFNNILEQNMRSIEEFKSDPKELKFISDLIKDKSEPKTFSQNVFLLFKAFDNKYYLFYCNKNNLLIVYDIFTNVKIKEIYYEENIPSCFNHYPDVHNKRDLIMTITPISNTINIYDFPNFKLILNFPKINKNGYLNTANFFSFENSIYVMTTNYRYSAKNVEPISIYDLKKNKIKELKDSNENVSFIDSYYDKKLSKKYIIASFFKYIRTYDYSGNKIYKTYKDKYKSFHRNVIVNDYEDEIKLIESGTDGYIRIWNFHKGDLIKRILIDKEGVYGICLWNKENLFVGIEKALKLINIETDDVILDLNYDCHHSHINTHIYDIIAIKKINTPQYGESLLANFCESSDIIMIKSK